MWAPGSSMATDLDIGYDYNLSNVDVTGLDVSGSGNTATLLAGTANSTQIYISTDSGLNWTRSRQEPTGQSKTEILMAPDFSSLGLAYAVTSGTESAFSYTSDGGITWNQIGLIDTKISSSGIIDLAVSPVYAEDNTLFMLTFDSEHIEHSLWRSLNSGATWERVFTSTLANADSIKLVELSPQYGRGSQVVFLTGTSGSNSVIWKSTDNGQAFIPRGVPFSIDTWQVVNDSTLLLGSYDGSHGLVYYTTNGGLSYSNGAIVGSQPLKSIAFSPNYEQDKSILIGNTKGWVYYSTDNGTSFKLLGDQLPLSATGLSEVAVAFDPNFSRNHVVYAATNIKVTSDSKKRIFRFIVDKSDSWESIDSTPPVGSIFNQITVSNNGILYAASSQAVDTTQSEGGMERSLNPTYSLGPAFETVVRGLEDGATLTGLWIQDNQLWSIDTTHTKLMTYIDSLAQPVILITPANGAAGTGTANISLDWEPLKGATRYEWQLDYDTDFSTIPSGFAGETDESSARSPALATATTYYWRVRAAEPVLSPWSAKWSFTTSLGASVIAPRLYSPEAGDRGTLIKPVFQWSAIAEADGYELLVAAEASFSNPVIVKIGEYSLPSTAWQSDISLDYNTTYFWKVRARNSSSYSDWSDVGAFTTEAPPQPILTPERSPSKPTSTLTPTLSTTPPSPPPSSPPSIPLVQSSIPDWAIYLGLTLLLTTVLLLVILLVMMVGTRRS